MATQNALNNSSYPFATTAMTIDPGASGDSYVQFTEVASTKWRLGVDDDDSDSFVLSQGSALGTNNTMRMTSNGRVTLPLQPSFLAYIASNDTNVTGNGTQYTLGTNVAFTQIADRNADFNTNGTFTAPVTGYYSLYSSVTMIGLTSTTLIDSRLVTSNRTYSSSIQIAATALSQSRNISSLVDMDAADTATTTITLTGDGADNADVSGTATQTFYSGALSV